ncbi:MAG TPA: transcriptional repressor LexA [Candidatus Hydrogenedentes bacterium]|nr:transcriptional repressor LexA [Candidatus Hydrogenedentota bacterium]HOV74372.1 transcriptional repressor LexA [Candidatus Hydrogenedentota bacterium]HPC16890.1 transcriptional repressor LexA [Candidatus Hydrogenedentota bacterium]HRT20715.1 transcriptional repressor LexA [Candidatus Hydrogenedentota bacterium]HRT66165.1 transcriptional repressor LexA [Candidatus Hydrogenedentota bacterium]
MAHGLTRRQAAILHFIVASIRDRGFPPTLAEIGDKFGIASLNGVNDHLAALERKGYIERSSKARGIRVKDCAAAGLYESAPGVLPLLGRIAAGQPLLAQENIEGHVPVSRELAGRKAYCLRVNGDSMIEAGILDGDIIVVDQERPPKPGDIVVALIGDEATVKRYYPHGKHIEFRPANPDMQPFTVPAQSVRMQGVVVALQRAIA